jgi:transcriptional regulator with XRE-family HTH domain
MRDYYAGVLSKLISARQEAGLTQREVSIRLGCPTLSRISANRREGYDVAELWAIGKLYGKSISFFAPDEP